MQEFSVNFGFQKLRLTLPQSWTIHSLEPSFQPPAENPQVLIARSLRHPVSSPSLSDIARGKRSAIILVPGKTRIAAVPHYLPPLINELNAGGIDTKQIAVVLATGTHEHHLEHDVIKVLGAETASQVAYFGHDCKEASEMEDLGTTSFGTPIQICRRVLSADVRVLTGRIVHHYFAGFSGGRKALVPGTAGLPTILANHRLTLHEDCGIHPSVRPGNLSGNPVHLDMVEAARAARPDFCLNTLLDTDGRLIDVVCGDWERAHEAGCRTAKNNFTCLLDAPVDAVITSPGGEPHDGNFIQAVKALFNVQDVVRPNAKILWIASCRGGIMPGFLKWAEIDDDEELEGAVRQQYNLAGHNSIMLRRLLRKTQVALYSELPADQVRKLGIQPLESIEQGVNWLAADTDSHSACALVTHANLVHATLWNE